MADQIYKVRDPQGNIREISGPAGASDDEVIAQAQKLFAAPEQPRQNVQAEVPAWGQESPRLYQAALAARRYGAPVLEAGGAIGGGLLGAPAGPAGVIGGSAGGYAAAKEAERLADLALGTAPAETPGAAARRQLGNLAEGAMYEMGGQLVGKGLQGGLNLAGKGYDWMQRLLASPQQRAANMLRAALESAPAARNMLTQPGAADQTAQQMLARVNPLTGQVEVQAPVLQGVIEKATKVTPQAGTYAATLSDAQRAAHLSALADIAGGATATEARAGRVAAKEALTEPYKQGVNVELGAANIAGEKVPLLERQIQQYADITGQKVEDVRRMVAAQARAPEVAGKIPLGPDGMPRIAGRYGYVGDLAAKADEVATQAAKDSLLYGEARRFSEAQLDSLLKSGLAPLQSNKIVAALKAKLADPTSGVPGNAPMETALQRVISDVEKWTDPATGVINAHALDSIRKSLNATIDTLLPSSTPQANKELAAATLSHIKPLFVDAIEKAGGTQYGKLLEWYSQGMQDIARTKLGAQLMDLYKTSPNDFVRVVRGEAPDVVEKTLGRGKFDINTELPPDTVTKLKSIAAQLLTNKAASEQASAMPEAVNRLIVDNAARWQLPWGLSSGVALANAAVRALNRKLGSETMAVIAEAAKTGESLEQLLTRFPRAKRGKVASALLDPLAGTAQRLTGPMTIAGKATIENWLSPSGPQPNTLGAQQ